MEKKRNYLLLILRGCAMGAADVVPGVSGGTIAFITGIYEELIDSIKSIDLQALKLLFSFRLADFWKNQWLLSAFCRIGNCHFHILIGQINDLATGKSSHLHLVILFRPDHCFHYTSGKRNQKMEHTHPTGPVGRSLRSLRHHSNDPCRNPKYLVVYYFVRSNSHLCNDPSGNFRGLYLAVDG